MLEAPSSEDELNLFEAKIVQKKSPNFSEAEKTSKMRKNISEIPENSAKKRKKKMPEKSAKTLKKIRSENVKKFKSEDVVTDLVLSDDDS